MKPYPIIHLVSSLLFITNLSFANPVTPEDPCKAAMSFELFLPPGLSPDEVVSFQLFEEGAASNIYEIRTADGQIVYEVISTAALRVLPMAAKYACIAVIKNPGLCRYVQVAGNAIITIFRDNIKEKLSNSWAARISGDDGYASLYTDNIDEAREGQMAFETSRKETKYPWTAPSIFSYTNATKRYGDGK